MLSVAIFVCLGWIISVCLHEFGHAIVAYWGGDKSVKDKGYLTLNPLKYTDINLSLTLPLIFVLMGGIPLPGAAVYINHNRLRNRWWQSAVSAAGPVTSAIVALFLALPFKLGLALPNSELWIWSALAFLIYLEIYVTIINSLPIPSLDGYGVIEPWLPQQVQAQLGKFSKYGILFLFGMLWFVQPVSGFLGGLSASIASFIGVPIEMIGEGSSLFHRSAGILLLAAIGIIFLIRRLTRKPHDVRFEQGQTFRKSGQYEKAIASYDQAIKHKHDYYEAWLNRGEALDNLQRDELAIASYEKAIEIQPNSYEAWYNKGWSLNRLKRYQKALTCYEKAIQIRPNDYAAWHSKGIVLETLQQYAQAFESYNRALKIQPDYDLAWYAWYGRGLALYELHRYEEAIPSYDKAIKLKPDYVLAWIYRGIILDKLQRYTEALESYEKARKIQPDYIDYWYYKGYTLAGMRRYQEAINYLDKAIQFNPKYTFAWYNKACCYAKQDKVDLAIESLEQAINIEPQKVREYAKTDPSFDSIRDNPLFKQLIDE